MYTPEIQEVIRLARTYNLIPVVRHLLADTETPIRVFHHLYQEPRAFLLESVEGGVKWARYSFDRGANQIGDHNNSRETH
jgi:anthranilate synthase component 1